ncbi:Myosin regulatory light chain 1 [Erysiphe necator]|nr:Myosin regulatory light chain 1 [Erysiphe necator]
MAMTIQGQASGHALHVSHTPPRISPFRRPDSIPSPSPLRQSTPSLSANKITSPTSNTDTNTNTTVTPTPSRPSCISSPALEDTKSSERINRNFSISGGENAKPQSQGLSPSQQRIGSAVRSRSTMECNTLSKLQPEQVRELREAFHILDRDSDGHVGREDVTDMFSQLGLSTDPSNISTFFPPSANQTITLPVFLNSLADILSTISPSSELISAFSAFDEDDSGQIDLTEFKDALLQIKPDPGVMPLTEGEIDGLMAGYIGRRAFRKQAGGGLGKRGEVFKYYDFIASISGKSGADGKTEEDKND